MAKREQSQEVAVPQSTALAFGNEVPDWLQTGGNRGSEEVGTKDMVLPRLEIVQALSPIKEQGYPEGHMYNSVTQQLYGEVVYFIPVYFRTEYLVWKDQDQGGGFFGSFDNDMDAKERLRQAVIAGEPEQFLEVVDTPVQYGLRVQPDGQMEQIVISMAKTKARVSRKWNAMIQLTGGDRFSRVYKVSTFKDRNKKNKEFYNFAVQPAGYPQKGMYQEAERLYVVFKAGDVKAAHDTVFENDEGGSTRREDIGPAPAPEDRGGI